MGICHVMQWAHTGALWQPRGVGGRFKSEGTNVYLWLIHIDIRQKPTQYCKAIIFQLKQMKKIKLHIQRVQSKDRKDIYWRVIWTLKKFFKNFQQEIAALEEINAIIFLSVLLELFCDYTNKCVCVSLFPSCFYILFYILFLLFSSISCKYPIWWHKYFLVLYYSMIFDCMSPSEQIFIDENLVFFHSILIITALQ